MELTVQIPTVLRDSTGGRDEFTVAATTLDEALRQLRADYPLLRVHVWDEAGRLRPHVLLFYNETSTKWLERMDIPLQSGDRLAIVQAVSGG